VLDIADMTDEPILSSALAPDSQEHRWPRRPIAATVLNETNSFVTALGVENTLAFHWLDIDMTSGNPMEKNPDGGKIVGEYNLKLRDDDANIKLSS
jgi:hypothetical protein